MVGGEFEVDGVWIQNTFTIKGVKALLAHAFQDTAMAWTIGLGSALPGPVLALGSMFEPAFLNGYNRQDLAGGPTNWPTIGDVNGESYVQSRFVTFPCSAPYATQINRLFLTDGTDVMAVSSILPGGMRTISVPFQTRYRFFIR